MGPADEFEAKLLVEKLKRVRQEIKEVQEFMEDVSVHFADYTWLLTIPGFGPYVSARVLASVADPKRFDSAKQLLRLAGYDLCASRSGKDSAKAIPKISKNGNAELRYALYQAAHVASTRNRNFIAYFNKLVRGRERERGIRTKMTVKLAAKMLVIAWTLMKRQEIFNPDYLNMA